LQIEAGNDALTTDPALGPASCIVGRTSDVDVSTAISTSRNPKWARAISTIIQLYRAGRVPPSGRGQLAFYLREFSVSELPEEKHPSRRIILNKNNTTFYDRKQCWFQDIFNPSVKKIGFPPLSCFNLHYNSNIRDIRKHHIEFLLPTQIMTIEFHRAVRYLPTEEDDSRLKTKKMKRRCAVVAAFSALAVIVGLILHLFPLVLSRRGDNIIINNNIAAPTQLLSSDPNHRPYVSRYIHEDTIP
jgi:hypothetical protein